MNSLDDLQKELGYNFKNNNLIAQALTHLSYANDNNVDSYERLEFLGDAVIELIVSDYIYNHFDFDVGTLTKLRASLVSTDYLCNISKLLGLDKLVKKSKSLQQLSKKNIADLFESVIGAVYLDGGLDSARKLTIKYIIQDDDNLGFVIKNSIDYKTKLQEYLQSKSQLFEYKLVSMSGPDHDKVFEVSLVISGQVVATEKGKSIQHAEENCAKIYLSKQ